VSEDTLQYRLEESIYYRRIRQVTQLFTYLLMHNLFSSCIRWYLVWRACDWVLCYLFPIQSAFLQYIAHWAAPALQHTIGYNTQYWTLDVAENLGRYLSGVQRIVQGKDFEVILTVKMETRHPVEGPFGIEFPAAICNHCGVMTAWSGNTCKFCEQFLHFFG